MTPLKLKDIRGVFRYPLQYGAGTDKAKEIKAHEKANLELRMHILELENRLRQLENPGG